jgi:hypothetical protein
MKIGIVACVVLLLAVSAGCTSSTTNSATATTAPTTVATKTPTAAPTVKATPKPADTSVDSDVRSVVANMESNQGYNVVVPVAYKTTDSHGDKVFTVTFSKGYYVYESTITKSETYPTATVDYNNAVANAKAAGFYGSSTYLSGYSDAWSGANSSGSSIAIGILSGYYWIVQMVVT